MAGHPTQKLRLNLVCLLHIFLSVKATEKNLTDISIFH